MSPIWIQHQKFCHFSEVFKGNRKRSIQWLSSSFSRFMDYQEVADVSQITHSLIVDWITHGSMKLNWSNKTVRNYLTALSLFLDWCVSQGLIEKNPANDIPRPKLEKTLPRNISKEETQLILDWTRTLYFGSKFQNARAVAIVSCFVYTGIRLSELINLRFCDVNFHDKLLKVKNGKGGKDRNIHLLPQLESDLQQYLVERLSMGRESQYFFTGALKDVKMGEKIVFNIVEKIRSVSGVYFSPHMLRHTFASLLNESNADIVTIQELMGHADITTTRRYTHVSNQHVKRQLYAFPL